jgi:hypothetical protein
VSPRYDAVDEAGRPIVAELGRAETPAEMADRKAAASANRRNNQTPLNLFIAVLASLVVVAFLYMVVVRPDQGPSYEAADYLTDARDASAVVTEPIVAPPLPEDWSANVTQLSTGSDGVVVWRVGFTTPNKSYLEIIQGIDANASWVADRVHDARAGDSLMIEGLRWTNYDRSDVANPGNIERALVTTVGGSTIVLAGTADDPEFTYLATAIAKDLA